MSPDEFRRRKGLYECVSFIRFKRLFVLNGPRALEGIKDKLELLSERSGTAQHPEKEGDMIAACDLADDLRDAIVEYQVGIIIEKHSG